jgi:SAM-dependent methyltransferase
MSETSRAYAEFAEESFSWQFIERPALDRALPDHLYLPEVSVLDIGSGSGRIIAYHEARGAHEANISAVEPDDTSIAICRQRFPHALLSHENVQDAELATNRFDIVTAHLSLQYLYDAELLITARHIRSSLKEEGFFYMLAPHPARLSVQDGYDRYFDEGVREVSTPWGSKEEYFYRTIGSYINTFVQAGLNVVGLDECPIAEGASETNPDTFADYNVSPSRFALLCQKATYISG